MFGLNTGFVAVFGGNIRLNTGFIAVFGGNIRFSLMANSKTNEGGKHPDRNKQFLHIHKKIIEFQKDGNPVISVDAKKKN